MTEIKALIVACNDELLRRRFPDASTIHDIERVLVAEYGSDLERIRASLEADCGLGRVRYMVSRIDR